MPISTPFDQNLFFADYRLPLVLIPMPKLHLYSQIDI